MFIMLIGICYDSENNQKEKETDSNTDILWNIAEVQ